jgi:hypothetical protein
VHAYPSRSGVSTCTRALAILATLSLSVAACSGSPLASSADASPPAAGGASGAAATNADGGGAGGAAGLSATQPDGGCVPNAYRFGGAVCRCQDGTPDVCSTGCTTLKLDVDNCGVCGRKCGEQQTCNDGVCGADPVRVLPPLAGCTALSLAVAGGALCFADESGGTINTLGAALPLVLDEQSPTWLKAVGGDLFWYDKDTKTIRHRAPGGATNDVYVNVMPAGVGGLPAPKIGGYGVSADGQTVYVGIGSQVVSAPAAGGVATPVAMEAQGGLVGNIAVSGSVLLYATGLNGDVDAPVLVPGGVATCGAQDPTSGELNMTTCNRIARGQGGLFLDWSFATSTNGYWIDGGSIKTEILAGPLAGGVNDDVAYAQSQPIVAAVANPPTQTIYFAEYGLDASTVRPVGFIEKTPFTINSTAVLLARGQNGITSMAVDATKVYWATHDCSIFSAAQ